MQLSVAILLVCVGSCYAAGGHHHQPVYEPPHYEPPPPHYEPPAYHPEPVYEPHHDVHHGPFHGGLGAALLFGGVAAAGVLGFATIAALAGRRRRSSEEVVSIQVERQQLVEQIMTYLDLAMDFDKDTYCLPKTFCEIMASKIKNTKGGVDEVIHAMYDKKSPVGKLLGSGGHTGANTILLAGLVGKYSRDPAVCEAAFPKCTLPLVQRRKLMENSFQASIKL